MLADFQQALCDLIADPTRVRRVRLDPNSLHSAYDLTDREVSRLATIAHQPGMAAACAVYRANRLAPLVSNLPRTTRAMAGALRPILEEFWQLWPENNVHTFVESERFCAFLEAQIAGGLQLSPEAAAAFAVESAQVRLALMLSATEDTQRNSDVEPRGLVGTGIGSDGMQVAFAHE